jgi:hypothetical protein
LQLLPHLFTAVLAIYATPHVARASIVAIRALKVYDLQLDDDSTSLQQQTDKVDQKPKSHRFKGLAVFLGLWSTIIFYFYTLGHDSPTGFLPLDLARQLLPVFFLRWCIEAVASYCFRLIAKPKHTEAPLTVKRNKDNKDFPLSLEIAKPPDTPSRISQLQKYVRYAATCCLALYLQRPADFDPTPRSGPIVFSFKSFIAVVIEYAALSILALGQTLKFSLTGTVRNVMGQTAISWAQVSIQVLIQVIEHVVGDSNKSSTKSPPKSKEAICSGFWMSMGCAFVDWCNSLGEKLSKDQTALRLMSFIGIIVWAMFTAAVMTPLVLAYRYDVACALQQTASRDLSADQEQFNKASPRNPAPSYGLTTERAQTILETNRTEGQLDIDGITHHISPSGEASPILLDLAKLDPKKDAILLQAPLPTYYTALVTYLVLQVTATIVEFNSGFWKDLVKDMPVFQRDWPIILSANISIIFMPLLILIVILCSVSIRRSLQKRSLASLRVGEARPLTLPSLWRFGDDLALPAGVATKEEGSVEEQVALLSDDSLKERW